MRAFVTGGTGFVGQHLIRLLVERGHEVVALSESRSAEQRLRQLGANPAPGDVTDGASLRAAMAACDTVIHAANQQLVQDDEPWQRQARIVAGTQNTLSAAHDLGIPRIVFVSNVSVFGDTNGRLVDESYVPDRAPVGELGRALWRAHYEVALPLVEQGAPIITVMPGAVYGPGDTGWLAQLMRRFYRGSLPVVPAPETTLTYAYVEDVARGYILAAERGRPGETYCLTGPAAPLGELVEFWSRLTGRKAPAVSLSLRTLQAVSPMIDAVTGSELAGYLGGTYMARSDKAHNELGWSTQPMQTTTLETFEWIAATEPADTWEKRRHLGFLIAGGAIGLLVLWLFLRRGDDDPSAG